MAYRYHVFLSYYRGSKVEAWVRNHFKPLLEKALNEHLAPDEVSIFYDQESLRSGQRWAVALADALLESCCLVPIWSQSYFRSPWCVAEWATFRQRSRELDLGSLGLVAPVAWDMNSFPAAAQPIHARDVSRYRVAAPAYSSNREYVDFERCVDAFAEDVFQVLQATPAFDAARPVVLPEIPPHPAGRYRISLLEHDPDVGDMLISQPPLIVRPTLAA